MGSLEKYLETSNNIKRFEKHGWRSIWKRKLGALKKKGSKTDYFFVGYDPGLTGAIALVDMKGGLAGVKSGRELKESEVVEFIRAFGKPVFVCADKTPPPAAVEKLAAIFEAGVFAPRDVLSVDDKRELCRELAIENAHERDAAAAALNAYNFHLNKIKNLRKKFADYEIAEILRGKPQNVPAEAAEEQKEKRITDVPALLRQMKVIEEDRRRLRQTIRVIEERLAAREKEKPPQAKEKSPDERIAEKNRRIAQLNAAVGKAEAALAEERKNKRTIARYYELALAGKKPAKVLEELSERAILELEKTLGIARGDVVACKKPGGKRPAEMLAQRGISVLIVKGLPEEVEKLLEEKKIIILTLEQVKIEYANGIAIVEKNEKAEDVEIEGIIKNYRESRGGTQTD